MVSMTMSSEHIKMQPLPELPERLPGLLSRAEFIVVVGLELEAFNSLRRRHQLPMVPPLHMPEAWGDALGWDPLAALALVMALQLTERYELSRTRAAEIARGAGRLDQRWPDISTTSLELADGKQPAFEILCASLDLPNVKPTKRHPDPTFAIGTLREIAAEHPTATGIIAVSVTRCAALMRKRAARAKIDLGDFWEV